MSGACVRDGRSAGSPVEDQLLLAARLEVLAFERLDVLDQHEAGDTVEARVSHRDRLHVLQVDPVELARIGAGSADIERPIRAELEAARLQAQRPQGAGGSAGEADGEQLRGIPTAGHTVEHTPHLVPGKPRDRSEPGRAYHARAAGPWIEDPQRRRSGAPAGEDRGAVERRPNVLEPRERGSVRNGAPDDGRTLANIEELPEEGSVRRLREGPGLSRLQLDLGYPDGKHPDQASPAGFEIDREDLAASG